ncbi:MAG: hypothetical protein WCI73_07190, partial [Phycisphaerae bacterium]
MLNRTQFMKSVLPVIDAVFAARRELEYGQERLGRIAVLGPTLDELSVSAPQLYAFIQVKSDGDSDSPWPACFEIDGATDLRSLIEKCWECYGEIGLASGIYVILPPGLDPVRQIKYPTPQEIGRNQYPEMPEDFQIKHADPDKLRVPRKYVTPTVSTTLLLLGLLPNTGGNNLIVIPDEELAPSGTVNMLQFYREASVRYHSEGSRSMSDMLDSGAFSEITRNLDHTPEPADQISEMRNLDQPFEPADRMSGMWTDRSVCLIPNFLWSWKVAEVPVTLMCLDTASTGF